MPPVPAVLRAAPHVRIHLRLQRRGHQRALRRDPPGPARLQAMQAGHQVLRLEQGDARVLQVDVSNASQN